MGMKINAELPLPAELKAEYPLSEDIIRIKEKRDREIRDIFTGRSDKIIVIVGPCSADNEDSVCEYVNRLAAVNEKVTERLMLIPRIFTHKPRPTGAGGGAPEGGGGAGGGGGGPRRAPPQARLGIDSPEDLRQDQQEFLGGRGRGDLVRHRSAGHYF